MRLAREPVLAETATTAEQPPTRVSRWQSAVYLAAAALLTALAFIHVPRGALKAPRTPFDRSDPAIAPVFAFLSRAAAYVPQGATVTVRSTSSDPVQDTNLHRVGVALLPGRHVAASARWGAPLPSPSVEYLILVGPPPALAPGAIVLSEGFGSVWRIAKATP